MPLFKLNPQIAVIDGNLVVPQLAIDGVIVLIASADVDFPQFVATGDLGADSAWSMPLFQISGRMQNQAFGEADLPLMLVDGWLPVSAEIAGGCGLPLLSCSGGMQAECNVLIPVQNISGTLFTPAHADGAVSIPLIALSGQVASHQWIEGTFVFPLCAITGTLRPTGAILDCAAFLPPAHVSGQLSLMQDFGYGNEEDSILKYSSNRRYI